MNDSSRPTFASRTPLRIGAAALSVRDLESTSRFYMDMLGLEEMERAKDCARLGAGGVTLLELEHRPNAKPDDAASAGLFHVAFLMPTRGDLGQWLRHVAKAEQRLDGASDHIVSEAIYLSDPEGNGIEVYADRPQDDWRRTESGLDMGTYPLDLQDLLAAGGEDAPWPGAPAGCRIGHIHLRVGDVVEAERFYSETVGMDITARVPGASFLSSGGYHHHIGTNIWRSRGAGRRDPYHAGLAWFSFEVEDEAFIIEMGERVRTSGAEAVQEPGGICFEDPWGTIIRAQLPDSGGAADGH